MTPERYQRLRHVLDRRQPDLTVVTDNVHKSRNLSAIVRTADAAGISQVHAVVADKDYWAFRGTAMGSHSWVEVQREPNIETTLLALKEQDFQILATQLCEEAVDYREPDYTKPTALLLGAEKRGISAKGLELADISITIPMMGMVQSYNVSVAAGIVLSEAQRQRQQVGMYDRPRLPDTEYQRLLFEWAHPEVRDYCQANGLAYPPLGEDGEIINPSAWYQQVKKRQQK